MAKRRRRNGTSPGLLKEFLQAIFRLSKDFPIVGVIIGAIFFATAWWARSKNPPALYGFGSAIAIALGVIGLVFVAVGFMGFTINLVKSRAAHGDDPDNSRRKR